MRFATFLRCSSISASSDAHFSLMDASCRRKAATLASLSFFSSASLSSTAGRDAHTVSKNGRSARVAGGRRTGDELDLPELALVRLGLDGLRALGNLLLLARKVVLAVRDLGDGALGVVRDGSEEVAGGGVVGVEAEVDLRVLLGEDGG